MFKLSRLIETTATATPPNLEARGCRMLRLTPEQMDVLAEMLNIGIGRSASALSDMVNQEVYLSAPQLEFVPRKEIITHFDSRGGDHGPAILEQSFSGPFSGKSLMIFSNDQATELVRTILPATDTKDPGTIDLLEHDALTEVGNLILTHSISGIADLCKTEIGVSLVTCHHGDLDALLGRTDDDLLLLLRVNFSLATTRVRGDLVFILDVAKMSVIIDSINALLDGQ